MTKLKWFRDRATRVSLATSAVSKPSVWGGGDKRGTASTFLARSGSVCLSSMRQPGPGPAAVQLLGLQKEGAAGSRPLYLCDIPHLLGGNGYQPLYTALLHLPFLLDDLLHDVVDVHLALGRNLEGKQGREQSGWGFFPVPPCHSPSLPHLLLHLEKGTATLWPSCLRSPSPISSPSRFWALTQYSLSLGLASRFSWLSQYLARKLSIWSAHKVLYILNSVRLESPRGKFTLPLALAKD